MKRWIRCSEEPIQTGFYFVAGNKGFFLESDASNITDNIARRFINAVCDFRNVGDKIRQSALYNADALKDFKRRITRATLEHIDTGKITYWSIRGHGFTENFPEEDFANDIILI